jgi:hypothetical protein
VEESSRSGKLGGGNKYNLKQDIDGEAIPQIQLMEQTALIISKIA